MLCSGEEAVLLYSIQGDTIDMYHTEVPASQRGKGVGGTLAQVRGGVSCGEGVGGALA